LVLRQHSSGGKQKLGRVSKQGDRYLRRLLTIAATAVMRRQPGKTDGHSIWVRALLERRPFRLVSLALANKMAWIAWVLTARQEDYSAIIRSLSHSESQLRLLAARKSARLSIGSFAAL
jgi:transposase